MEDPAPVRDEPAARAGERAEQNSDWRAIALAGTGIVVVALVGYFLFDSAWKKAQRTRAEVEDQQASAERGGSAGDAAEARERALKAKARSDRAAREQAERERLTLQTEREALQESTQQPTREMVEREAREKAAREAAAKTGTKAAAYDLAQLDPSVRAAVEQARDAEKRANAAAARARDAAEEAEAKGVSSPDSGVGTRSLTGDSAGNRYAGFFERGLVNGVGVFSYAQNAKNTGNTLRYEGEWVNSVINGVGVFFWRDGDRYAGSFRNDSANGPGVGTHSSGVRYEGEYANNKRSGYGVRWSSQGNVLETGVWADNKLTTPLGPQGR